ncbi:MAG: hypothetical protein H0X30_12705 [Anaerolineae bacterium]|nr:hypothetical protein [Anaerolineae bacterium]
MIEGEEIKWQFVLQIVQNLQISRRNGRRMRGSNPPNWHFCTAVGSADAASAAVGSVQSAAAQLALSFRRM